MFIQPEGTKVIEKIVSSPGLKFFVDPIKLCQIVYETRDKFYLFKLFNTPELGMQIAICDDRSTMKLYLDDGEKGIKHNKDYYVS
jgi:hypothetical protein